MDIKKIDKYLLSEDQQNESEDGVMATAHPHGGRGRQGYNKGLTCPHCGKNIVLER
jgi:hypothetical protein